LALFLGPPFLIKIVDPSFGISFNTQKIGSIFWTHHLSKTHNKLAPSLCPSFRTHKKWLYF